MSEEWNRSISAQYTFCALSCQFSTKLSHLNKHERSRLKVGGWTVSEYTSSSHITNYMKNKCERAMNYNLLKMHTKIIKRWDHYLFNRICIIIHCIMRQFKELQTMPEIIERKTTIIPNYHPFLTRKAQ